MKRKVLLVVGRKSDEPSGPMIVAVSGNVCENDLVIRSRILPRHWQCTSVSRVDLCTLRDIVLSRDVGVEFERKRVIHPLKDIN